MPPAIIPAIIMGAMDVAQVGMQLAGVGQPGRPPAPTVQPLTTAQNKQQQSAVGQALPDLQSLTGGSLNPEYAAQFGATQAGVANDPQATGNIQAAINQYFGLGAPGQSGLTPTSGGGGIGAATSGMPGILDLLSRGGATRMPGGGGGQYGDWINQVVGGNQFQGLQATG